MPDKPQDAGTGALFKNDRKERPSHPDYRGDCEINGEKFWIAAWIKKSEKDGRTYMSLAFRPKEEQAKPKPKTPTITDADDIPF